MVAAPAFGLCLLIGEALRRDSVLANGAKAVAIVEGRRYGTSRTNALVCKALIGYRLDGKAYQGEWRDCPAGSTTGSRVKIAYDPADPAGAFVAAEGHWRSGDLSSLLILATIFLLASAGYGAFLRDCRRETKDRGGRNSD